MLFIKTVPLLGTVLTYNIDFRTAKVTKSSTFSSEVSSRTRSRKSSDTSHIGYQSQYIQHLLQKAISFCYNSKRSSFPEVSNCWNWYGQGYTYELTLTHFPLLPLVVRTIANSLEWLTKDLCSVFHFASLVKVSCVGLNFVAFVVAADLVNTTLTVEDCDPWNLSTFLGHV